MEAISEDTIPDIKRILLCRIVFAFILFTLIFDAVSNTLFHQLQAPVLKFPYVDPVYWLMHLFKIPDLIVSHNSIAYIFDVLLFATCISCIVYPFRRILIALFLLIYFVYFITYNSYGAHHVHSKIGILLIPLPFLFRSDINFSLVWHALRYYALFIFSSAFLLKVFRLSFLQKDHGLLILKNNLVAYLYYHPNTLLANCYWWILKNPSWANAMYIIGFILEGIFIVGFITKKFDRYLLVFSLILISGFWFFADAFSFQLLILSFTFIDFNKKISSPPVTFPLSSK